MSFWEESKRGRKSESVERFNPWDDDVLWKDTNAALLHPMEVDENSVNENYQKDEVSYSVRKVTAMKPMLEAARKLCESFIICIVKCIFHIQVTDGEKV